ncbi:hypothetical protein [Nocardioides nematodiphilus]|uniref:hypothetical protein n=1 Tax=Nocardioides nematodiphilus TaxID=2849669 RepID=UPI001CDA2BB4|nr:hypothetical protein [Nocardioides nematodiphilus]MCA1981270.1 hypothetical protein [Nocardioides nematodiphilus]
MVILVVLCATVMGAVATASIFGSKQTGEDEFQLQALSAAEAGRDDTYAKVRGGGCNSTPGYVYPGSVSTGSFRAQTFWVATTDPSTLPTSPPASTGCPPVAGATDGYVGIASLGTAGTATKSVLAWYRFTRTLTPTGGSTTSTTTLTAIDGAILEGGNNSISIPNVKVTGDVVLGAGSFNCNGSSVIDGDLIVGNGSVDLSNQCRVTGSIVAKGDVYIHNLTNQVGGDVVSTTGTVRVEGAQVGGSIKADGGVQLNNSVKVTGDVVARGDGAIDCKGSGATGSAFTGSSSSSKTVGGNVRIGGALCQVDLTTVTGSIIATGTGETSIGGVGTVKATSIQLAGTCSPCTATPVPKTGVKGLAAVDFTDPPEAGFASWLEVPWAPSAWTKTGWTVATASTSDCDYQNKASLVTAINNLTQPTVIDATACPSGINLYGVTFTLKTDVTFIAKAYAAQSLTAKVAGTGTRTFNLIVPDPTSSDNAPTCPSGPTGSTIYGATLGLGVTGIAYTPCTLAIGTVSWAGQIVAGYPDPAGGNNTITYTPIGVPGSTVTGGGTVPVTIPGPVVPPVLVPSTTVADSANRQTEPRWTP